MKRKFTFLISAAVMLLTMMATTGEMWGQSRTTKTYKLTITASNFNTTSYAANNNEKTTNAVNVSDNTDTYEVKWTSYQVMKNSDNMQWQKSKGYIYNSTDLGTITSVTVTSSAGSFTTYYGTSAQPSSGTSGSGKGYFKTNVGGATGTTSKVEIMFEIEEGGPTQLDTPTNFAASPGNAQATFTWDEVDNAESYTISYTTDGETWTDIENIVETSYTKTGLTNGTEYTCKIKAVGDGENYSDSDYSSTITVTPTAATYYDITITTPLTGGSVSASAATATSGTTVTLTATPSAGYTFSNIASNWSVEADEGDDPEVTPGEGNTATFTMPASDVTVSAIFTAMPVYTVTCTTPTNGTLSASPTSGYNGVQVTITATPNSGYELATLTATDSEGEITITDNKFNIRNSNVTVAATFTAAVVYEWVPVAIDDITAEDIFVIVGTNNGTFAMTNNNGTGSAPTATSVTISGGKITSTVTDVMKWNISGNATDGYTFYPNGTTSTWLYCNTTANSGSNNNMRVGTGSRKVFEQNASNYLLTKDANTDRYVSVYNGSDWRGYVNSTTEPTTVAFYKRTIPAAVATPTFSVAAGTYNANQSVTITCATDGATIYYTTDGSEPTNLSSEYTEPVSITQTTTLKAIAIKNAESSNVASATYTLKCATPTFSPVGGAYIGAQSVTISCATDGASVYYTLDGTTPTSSSTLYSSAISISETKTLKAIAIKSNWSDSDVQSATYTITVPLTTMDEILAKAIAVGSTETSVYVTFDNWVISGVSGSTAYLTDGTKGCIIYKSGHGFSVGNILSGTAQCKIKLYNNAPELTNLTSVTSGLTVNTGGTISPTTTTISALSAVNTGAAVTIKDLTYTSSTVMLSDGTNDIKPKNTLYDFSSNVTNGKKYHVTGIFVIYGSEKQIYPRSAADIVLAADMSLTDLSGLTTFTYLYSSGGPSAKQDIDIYGSDFAGDMTVTASSDYEVSLDNSTYSASVVLEPSTGNIAETIHVRLKEGLATGTHNGTLTFTATNLTTVEQNLTGNVSENQTYAITLIQPSYATIAADFDVAEAGETVTLSYSDLDDCYNFTSWSVYKTGDQSTTVTVNGNEFTMPGYDVTATATLTQKTFTVNYSVNGVIEPELIDDNISCGNEAALWDEDDLESAGVAIPSGFDFMGWSASVSGTIILNSFIPTENTTLYAVLLPTGATTNYVKVTENLTDWSGEYLIVYETDGVALDGSINNTTYDKISNNISVTITNGKIVSTNTIENSRFIVEKYGDDYTLKSAAGYYIGRTDNSTGINASTSVHYTNTFSISEGNVVITASNSYVLRYNASDGQNRFRYYAGNSVKAIQIYRKEVPVPYTYIENVTSTTAAMTNIEEGYLITVEDGGILNLTGTNNGTAANLIIKDGGQLIHTAAVNATIQKGITAASSWKDDVDGWYFIASPVDVSTSVVAVGSYDLFAYNEPNAYWYSSTGTGGPFNTLERGQGYLYANSANQLLAYAGSMVATNDNIEKDLSYEYDGGDDLKGFNLMGNPFTRNLTTDDMKINTTDVTAYYGISDDTKSIVSRMIASKPIKPGEGFMVQVNDDNKIDGQNKLYFNPTAKDEPENNGYISIVAGNENGIDNAYIQIGNGNTLRKMSISNSTEVYVMNDDKDFAAARIEELAGTMPVNFEAVEDGTYTITVEAKFIEAHNMHLIDNFTGADIDLLVEPSYTFNATANDNAERFTLVFDFNNYTGCNENYTSDNFIYQSGDEIIVNGEGELKVFDVLGRFVMSQNVSGVERINKPAQTGVYIFMMNGNAQKIVVK